VQDVSAHTIDGAYQRLFHLVGNAQLARFYQRAAYPLFQFACGQFGKCGRDNAGGCNLLG